MSTIEGVSSGGTPNAVAIQAAAAQVVRRAPLEMPAEAFERSQQALRASAKVLEEFAARNKTSLRISFNREAGLYVIRVTSAKTGRVIMEIPPEQVLESAVMLMKNARAVLNRQT